MKVSLTFDSIEEMMEHVKAEHLQEVLGGLNKGVTPLGVNPMVPFSAPVPAKPEDRASAEKQAELDAKLKASAGKIKEPQPEQAALNQQAQVAQAAASPMVVLPEAQDGEQPKKTDRMAVRARLAALNKLAGTDVAKAIIRTLTGTDRFTDVPDERLADVDAAISEAEAKIKEQQ